MNVYLEKDGRLIPKLRPIVRGGLKLLRGLLGRRCVSRAFPDACENILVLSVFPFTATPFFFFFQFFFFAFFYGYGVDFAYLNCPP